MAVRMQPPFPDLEQLSQQCEQRLLNERQRRWNDIQTKRDEIERAVHLSSEEEEGIRLKPYGLPLPWQWEGDAPVVWCRILEHVTESSEIKKLWEVSDIFRDILRPKYIQTVLPEIVKLIKDKRPKYLLHENFKEDFDHYNEWFHDHYENKVKDRVFLGLRLLSRLCKRSMESHGTDYFVIRRIEQLQLMCEAINANTYKNDEFYPREIEIDEDWVTGNYLDVGAFHQGITALFRMVGHRIRIFEYCAYIETHREIYDNLRQWVALMPNLERLCLFIGNGNIEAIPIALEEVPAFPHSPSITRYHDFCNSLPAPYTQRILEACPGIEELVLYEMEPVREHSVQVLEDLRNLSSLNICPYPGLLDRHDIGWNLNKLVLFRMDMTHRGQGTFSTAITTSQLFPFLRQFEGTLEHLEVTVDLVNNGGYLELPNLKTFKWKHHGSFQDIRFLLPAEKLEKIEVEVWESFRPNNEKFKRITRDVNESFLGMDIWQLFPCLKLAEVRNAQYNRHGVPRTRTFWRGSRRE